jgi:hypothetical protein
MPALVCSRDATREKPVLAPNARRRDVHARARVCKRGPMISHRTLALAIALAAAACGPNLPPDVATTTKAQSPQAAIRAAVAMPHRSEANRKRDVYRHPIETLSFFGVKPDMTVVEMFPGQGWYTEILAPLLADPS